MLTLNHRFLVLCLLTSIVAAPAARAQWAVIDVPAIAQLIQEVQTMQQQLATARSQLQSTQQALQAMTGSRGMQTLLSGITRNYLPVDWAQITNMLQGQSVSGYSAFSAAVRSTMSANAILSPQRLAMLSASDQLQTRAARQSSAMQQVLSQQALANASNRFASIQSLISAIPAATDQKGILDLQARISAELGMLQNEQTKMQVLYQATQAQESANRQQALERAVQDQGSFATRFQPVP
ncbi:MAG TPA: type IV secretion system protein [Steroidobacteraceae bacterium]